MGLTNLKKKLSKLKLKEINNSLKKYSMVIMSSLLLFMKKEKMSNILPYLIISLVGYLALGSKKKNSEMNDKNEYSNGFINCDKRCMSFHEHNEDKILLDIINKIKKNKNVSIVSDAGTPSISDPGYKLIKECIKQSIDYTLIPGPSSIVNAIVMSGLPSDKFSFFGFMPKKSKCKKCFLKI